jgi:hypothetical protein
MLSPPVKTSIWVLLCLAVGLVRPHAAGPAGNRLVVTAFAPIGASSTCVANPWDFAFRHGQVDQMMPSRWPTTPFKPTERRKGKATRTNQPLHVALYATAHRRFAVLSGDSPIRAFFHAQRNSLQARIHPLRAPPIG